MIEILDKEFIFWAEVYFQSFKKRGKPFFSNIDKFKCIVPPNQLRSIHAIGRYPEFWFSDGSAIFYTDWGWGWVGPLGGLFNFDI